MTTKYLKLRIFDVEKNMWSKWQTFKTTEFNESLLGDFEYEIDYLGSWKVK